MNKTESLFEIHNTIHENIKFADTKAAVILILNTGFVGGLYGLKILENDKNVVVFLAITSFVIQFIGIALALGCLCPRGVFLKMEPGVVDPIRIAAHTSLKAFRGTVGSDFDRLLNEQLTTMIYQRGKINTTKYKFIVLAGATSVVGWLTGIAALVWKSL